MSALHLPGCAPAASRPCYHTAAMRHEPCTKIDLEAMPEACDRVDEGRVVDEAEAVGVDHHQIDRGARAVFEHLQELRMDGRLAAGALHHFGPTLDLHEAIDLRSYQKPRLVGSAVRNGPRQGEALMVEPLFPIKPSRADVPVGVLVLSRTACTVRGPRRLRSSCAPSRRSKIWPDRRRNSRPRLVWLLLLFHGPTSSSAVCSPARRPVTVSFSLRTRSCLRITRRVQVIRVGA